MNIRCLLWRHDQAEKTRYTMSTGYGLCDQTDRLASNYILVVSRCSRCGHRTAVKKNMSNHRSLDEDFDLDVADEMIDRYEKKSTMQTLKEL